MSDITLAPLPMQEAVEFWRDKIPLSPGQFAQLAKEAKTRAFAVSGIAKGDELATVFQAMEKAIAKGTTFAEFKNDCRDIMARRGWSGPQAWRVENIFRTNIQTAYSVGRYKQMQETKKRRPYWRYSAVDDRRTRPEHLAMDGKIYPADHPFWETWYPPNGYRCRCGVSSLSQNYVDRHNLTVETDDPTGKLFEPIDPQTGEKMPARLLFPDPAWDHNPGKTVWGEVSDDPPSMWQPLPNLKTAGDYRRKSLENISPADIADLDASRLLPAGQSDAFYLAEFAKLYGTGKVLTDAAGDPVILSPRSFMRDKTNQTWKFNKEGHGESIPLLEEMVSNPYEIWLTPQKNSKGKIRLSKRYINLWKTPDKKKIAGLAVYEVVDGIFAGVTNFIPITKGKPNLGYAERQREGLLLYQRK